MQGDPVAHFLTCHLMEILSIQKSFFSWQKFCLWMYLSLVIDLEK